MCCTAHTHARAHTPSTYTYIYLSIYIYIYIYVPPAPPALLGGTVPGRPLLLPRAEPYSMNGIDKPADDTHYPRNHLTSQANLGTPSSQGGTFETALKSNRN